MMLKKEIVFLVGLLLLLPYASAESFAESRSDDPVGQSCEDLDKVYKDALNQFTTFKGKEKVKKTMLGTVLSNDYSINLWDALSADLTEIPELNCNQLVYVYVESRMLADGKNTYAEIVRKFEACLPEAYLRVDDGTKNYIARSHYIDEKDKDAFLYYDWPEFEISLINQSDVYIVKLTILSKKND